MTIITKKINRKKLIKQLQVSDNKYITLIIQSDLNCIIIKDNKQTYQLLTE